MLHVFGTPHKLFYCIRVDHCFGESRQGGSFNCRCLCRCRGSDIGTCIFWPSAVTPTRATNGSAPSTNPIPKTGPYRLSIRSTGTPASTSVRCLPRRTSPISYILQSLVSVFFILIYIIQCVIRGCKEFRNWMSSSLAVTWLIARWKKSYFAFINGTSDRKAKVKKKLKLLSLFDSFFFLPPRFVLSKSTVSNEWRGKESKLLDSFFNRSASDTSKNTFYLLFKLLGRLFLYKQTVKGPFYVLKEIRLFLFQLKFFPP